MNNFDTTEEEELPSPKYLTVGEDTECPRRISYYQVEGSKEPGVVFIPGFMAHKNQRKSVELLLYCRRNDIPCISYDTAGFGDSIHEIKRTEARFHHWLQDAREVLQKLTSGPQVVIGSSMGGWLSLILAQEIPEKFAGLVLLAPAYNFGETSVQKIDANLPQEIKDELMKGIVIEKVDPKFEEYGPVPLSYDLFKGMIPFNIPLEEDKIDIEFPVRIIHGTKDELFPTARSEALISPIQSKDMEMKILKGCFHELSDPKSLKSIFAFVEELRQIHLSSK